MRELLMIEDEYQTARMEWVLGKQVLSVSVLTKNINALSAKNF